MDISQKLLKRYLTSKCIFSEEKQVENWLSTNDSEEALKYVSSPLIYQMSSPSKGFYELNNPWAFKNFSGDGIPSKYYKICLKS